MKPLVEPDVEPGDVWQRCYRGEWIIVQVHRVLGDRVQVRRVFARTIRWMPKSTLTRLYTRQVSRHG